MKVDIQDVLFWMDAIRNSEDRYRTLESFWKGQVNSKVWLAESLQGCLRTVDNDVVVHGGWNGVLSSILFNAELNIKNITSVVIDPACEEVAYTVNKRYEMEGRFKAVTSDMCDYDYESVPDVVINTSCEHITPEQYRNWLNNVPKDSLVVVQSNDYFELDEHINCMRSMKEFQDSSRLDVIYKDKLVLPKYTRFMLIGYKK